MSISIPRSDLRHILLDIEGTVADVRFVYDVMFPFAKMHMLEYLQRHWAEPETQKGIEQVARDAGLVLSTWLSTDAINQHSDAEKVNDHLQSLMAGDSKATGLKQLQGLVWQDGFHRGDLRAELFPDVLPAFRKWKAEGLDLSIYSSGSVLAQKLFFGHTTEGDLRPLLSNYFDTQTGKKQESESYSRIAKELALNPASILFISDVAAELEAAAAAGMLVLASVRDGNKPLDPSYSGASVRSFQEIQWCETPIGKN
ncbi:MAG: acireductone synthase [Pirellula sp.]|jgi:enolase-phosphatase E1|nr:acireductone synthase [Pirellula sp.]